MKEIKGQINYTIQISEDGAWNISYGKSDQTEQDQIHNDIATLVVAQHVMEQCAVMMKSGKNGLKGTDKKYMTQKLDKIVQGRFGLKLMADYLIDCYDSYMEHISKKKEVPQVDKSLEVLPDGL